jgi:hypothetical protein
MKLHSNKQSGFFLIQLSSNQQKVKNSKFKLKVCRYFFIYSKQLTFSATHIYLLKFSLNVNHLCVLRNIPSMRKCPICRKPSQKSVQTCRLYQMPMLCESKISKENKQFVARAPSPAFFCRCVFETQIIVSGCQKV